MRLRVFYYNSWLLIKKSMRGYIFFTKSKYFLSDPIKIYDFFFVEKKNLFR